MATRAVRAVADRIRARVGRRGSTLLFLAILDAVYAVALVTDEPVDGSSTSSSYQFAESLMPLEVWAALWGCVGAACLIQAFQNRDQFAFGCAVALKIGWGGMYLLAVLQDGAPRGYVAASIWWLFAAWLFIISGWPERSTRSPAAPGGDPAGPQP